LRVAGELHAIGKVELVGVGDRDPIEHVVVGDADPVAGDDRRGDRVADKLGVDRARDRDLVAGVVDRDRNPGAGDQERADKIANVLSREEIAGELLDDPRQLIERASCSSTGKSSPGSRCESWSRDVLRSIRIVAPIHAAVGFRDRADAPPPPATV
jgi:hypothetical protein